MVRLEFKDQQFDFKANVLQCFIKFSLGELVEIVLCFAARGIQWCPEGVQTQVEK